MALDEERIAALQEVSELRYQALMAKLDSKFDLVMAVLDRNHAELMWAINIHKRLQVIERKIAEPTTVAKILSH